MATTFHKVKDNWYALLDGAINNSVTSIVIDGAGAGGEPTVPFYCDIDSEAIRVSAVATNTPTAGKSTLTVTRAQLGTSAASHSDNAAVQQNAYAQQLTEIHTAVNGIENGTTTLAEVNVTGDVVAGGDLIGDNVSVGADDAAVARHIVNCGPAGVGAVEFQDAGVKRLALSYDAAGELLTITRYNSSGASPTGVFSFSSDTGAIVATGDTRFNGSALASGAFRIGASTPVISSGVAAYTSAYAAVDTEAAAATDDLDTMTGASVGAILVLRTLSDSRDVTVKHSTATNGFRLAGGADFAMTTTRHMLMCIHNGTAWLELSRSTNS